MLHLHVWTAAGLKPVACLKDICSHQYDEVRCTNRCLDTMSTLDLLRQHQLLCELLAIGACHESRVQIPCDAFSSLMTDSTGFPLQLGFGGALTDIYTAPLVVDALLCMAGKAATALSHRRAHTFPIAPTGGPVCACRATHTRRSTLAMLPAHRCTVLGTSSCVTIGGRHEPTLRVLAIKCCWPEGGFCCRLH